MPRGSNLAASMPGTDARKGKLVVIGIHYYDELPKNAVAAMKGHGIDLASNRIKTGSRGAAARSIDLGGSSGLCASGLPSGKKEA